MKHLDLLLECCSGWVGLSSESKEEIRKLPEDAADISKNPPSGVTRMQTGGGEVPLPWSRCWCQRMLPSCSRLGKGMVEERLMLCKLRWCSERCKSYSKELKAMLAMQHCKGVWVDVLW